VKVWFGHLQTCKSKLIFHLQQSYFTVWYNLASDMTRLHLL
jgi:hypothetical protein